MCPNSHAPCKKSTARATEAGPDKLTSEKTTFYFVFFFKYFFKNPLNIFQKKKKNHKFIKKTIPWPLSKKNKNKNKKNQ